MTASTCIQLNTLEILMTCINCINLHSIWCGFSIWYIFIWLKRFKSQLSKTLIELKISLILRKLWARMCIESVSFASMAWTCYPLNALEILMVSIDCINLHTIESMLLCAECIDCIDMRNKSNVNIEWSYHLLLCAHT